MAAGGSDEFTGVERGIAASDVLTGGGRGADGADGFGEQDVRAEEAGGDRDGAAIGVEAVATRPLSPRTITDFEATLV
ncbi:hypothetical protein [Nocardia xishanensis]|uniref:Uncharacterized protein n=1 Tax=Nocardia xishanensis TaxID=238964 RepID=A0ABW7WW81_9NOCA